MALNPFIDFTSMDEAVPMATVENAIEVIKKDYNDKIGNTNFEVQSSVEGPIDFIIPGGANVKLNNMAQMSDNMSFRSTNYIH